MIRQEIADNTGLLVQKPNTWLCSEEHYLWAAAGSRLLLKNALYEYKVYIYRTTIDTCYVHTYDYAPEESWCSYQPVVSRLAWGQQDFVFEEPCFFRVSVRRIDGSKAAEIETLDEVIFFEQNDAFPKPKVFANEVQQAAERVRAIYRSGDIVLAVLTDTHRTVNGTWEDTVANLQALGKKIALDGVVHLGDFTDGVVSRAVTTYYVQGMLQDMQRLQVPVMTVLGNHDANYFRQNPDIMTLAEQVSLYQSATEPYKDQHRSPYYSVTLAQLKLKLFFLSAYDNAEELRYGFDTAQLQWLEKELYQQPSNYKSIVFSHDAPDAALDYWASEIRNGPELLQILEKYQQQILAFIHGHTHADAIHREYPCPIVSIGCAKCEDMPCFKPAGALTPLRALVDCILKNRQ
ncbi:MAG: metallophosphoesterase [Selenomonas sp.]|nr:metallophosphoesterase [Selenomonas sp.]